MKVETKTKQSGALRCNKWEMRSHFYLLPVLGSYFLLLLLSPSLLLFLLLQQMSLGGCSSHSCCCGCVFQVYLTLVVGPFSTVVQTISRIYDI